MRLGGVSARAGSQPHAGFAFPSIEGYLFPDEGQALYELARTGEGAVVELGSYKGLSTVCLAQGIRDRGSWGHLFAVDHFQGEPELTFTYKDYQSGEYRGMLGLNLDRYGVSHIVTVVSALTDAAAARQYPQIGLIFVDAAHDYEPVSRDWQAWKEKSDAFVFHDRGAGGVGRLLEEIVADGGWFRSDGPGSLAWVGKQPYNFPSWGP